MTIVYLLDFYLTMNYLKKLKSVRELSQISLSVKLDNSLQ